MSDTENPSDDIQGDIPPQDPVTPQDAVAPQESMEGLPPSLDEGEHPRDALDDALDDDGKHVLHELSGKNAEDYEEETQNNVIDSSNPMSARDLEAVYGIPVRVSAVLGKARIQISQLLKLEEGTIVELDRKVGEAIDIYVNDRLVARGEVVVVDNKLGVTMTEIVKSEQ